jgi:hypothetical protein
MNLDQENLEALHFALAQRNKSTVGLIVVGNQEVESILYQTLHEGGFYFSLLAGKSPY